MKVIPVLVGVLAAATIASAGAIEKLVPQPGGTILRPARPEASAAGSRRSVKPPNGATNAVDPRVHVTAPPDVIDGDATDFQLSVTNEGDIDLLGPITIEFEATPAFDSATTTGTGWSCVLPTHTCEWTGNLPAGGTTDVANFHVVAAPPYSPRGDCDRSPCLVLRATVSGYPGSTGAGETAVTIGGHTPPNAMDDVAYMPTPPLTIQIDPLLNDGVILHPALEIVEDPAQGTVTVDVNNVVTYTPGPGFSGEDAFRYRVGDDQEATDTAMVRVRTLTGGITFSAALLDIGQVEIGRVAMLETYIENTTGVWLEGVAVVEEVPPAEVAAILAATGYDPSRVAFDPLVFRPRSGTFVEILADPLSFTLVYVRPDPPLETVWLARVRVDAHPSGSPFANVSATTVIVARSATAAEAPVHILDDAITVPPDVPTMLRPLANDDSAAGHVLSVTTIYSADPWFLDPESAVGQYQVADAQGPNGTAPYLGILYTPPPGYTGTNAMYYAASEIVNHNWSRFDFAKISLNVGNVPAPVAVASGSATICAGASTGLTGSGGASCSWSPATGLDDPSSCTPIASPASTTTYTLIVRDASNQPSTNNPTVTVTVEALPIAVAGGSATINSGQSTPLSGSGGASCSWSPATALDNAASCAPIASPTATTTYALVVTSAAGCASTNAATATITVVPAGLPDLVVPSVTAPLLSQPGRPINIAVRTRNAGANPAAASTTRVYLSRDLVIGASDVSLGQLAVPGLAAGQTHAATLNTVVPSNARGFYFLIAAADDDQVVAETNEGNNRQFWVIFVF